MIFLSSPAKTLDFERSWQSARSSNPLFLDQSAVLAAQLATLSVPELAKTLKISPKLAQLNHQRYQTWKKIPAKKKAKPAIFAYQGDVYQQLQARLYTADQQKYAQQSLRIISGLYGLLRPYDLILPYRLEMSASLPFSELKSLYNFWSGLTGVLLKEAAKQPESPILDIASQEYSKVIDFKQFTTPWIRIEFRQIQAGKMKNSGLLAKKARGMMIEHLIRMQAEDLELVKQFNSDGYQLYKDRQHEYVFLKEA